MRQGKRISNKELLNGKKKNNEIRKLNIKEERKIKRNKK